VFEANHQLSVVPRHSSWEFRADGTSHNYSGSEESISQYRVSDEPTAAGYYILLDTITETNGQPDCLGNTVPVGDRATGYLVPAPGDQLRLCSDTALTECFTMVRVARPNSGAKVVESTLPDPDAVLTDTVPCRVGRIIVVKTTVYTQESFAPN